MRGMSDIYCCLSCRNLGQIKINQIITLTGSVAALTALWLPVSSSIPTGNCVSFTEEKYTHGHFIRNTCTFIELSKQPIILQQLNAKNMLIQDCQDSQLLCYCQKCYHCDVDWCLDGGARRVGLRISETADL